MLHAMAEEKLFKGWPTLAQMTTWYRPWVTVCLQGVIVFLIATIATAIFTLPSSIGVIGNLCNLGVFLSFILPLVSLIHLQRTGGKASKIPLTIAALIAVLGFTSYTIYVMGSTMTERLLYGSPMILALIIGAFIMSEQVTSEKK